MLVAFSLLSHVRSFWSSDFVWTIELIAIPQPWAVLLMMSVVLTGSYIAGALGFLISKNWVSKVFAMIGLAGGVFVQVTPNYYAKTSWIMLLFLLVLPVALGLIAAGMTNLFAGSFRSLK
jgi:hypothetical protein